ncbi:hypothetical protein LBMAG18_09370 [Alphaproteobacteria bacterium]|nr:hypothetical protein LBMAG18_09370 [Alphaproteobacteria bacterium]
MHKNNQTNTNNDDNTDINFNLNSIFDKKYIKKLRTKTQNYSIATILFFFSGLGLNSIDDLSNSNQTKRILNHYKPFVIFLSMPFGILMAINGMKLISAKDFSIFDSKRNLRNSNQKPLEIDRKFTENLKFSSSYSFSPSIPDSVVYKPKSTQLSPSLITHDRST